MSTKAAGAGGAVIIVAIVAAVALFAGGEDEEAQASAIDGAFIAEMTPHHEMAIEMAEIATERAQHPEVRQLAEEIIQSQSSEIEILADLHERLFGEPVGAVDHAGLGVPEEHTGMDMDASMLETAKPFDREFIDMMIPHHQGAIRMARIELEEGADDATKSLARAIIDAQAREITEMNKWRTAWYGAPSPAGGVPSEEESLPPEGGAETAPEHEGH